ncbi:PTS system mannose/fructose/sorbose family transporter subunit IID [Aerococcus urinae]|uniref:PTS system mannose/fructose/sorbose family transporter subunit IID n=1 Tax=Aerococcus urinae TaxID=1376 RepID=A0A0X8FFV0_9LACT|nr:PTS system mannose/fructose/sorbose family transporter subunit IID [Aerococcus urinae]AMB96450.1 PTS mannose transporter subunit IID [Aerococcus urinae]MCY3032177.1 PTS system mannose/fructose/sorbose family transporter subunit IID [Aerococcus urinae]MCY3037683.1 PTS system mannose/fructose/sorbose family transporter subunit IID [Aerococcus urinae]MCY3044223.1 PTS system mannose/fructose/sorbose family transporter subunit IID [Aerococcus urinae]MCY3045652.1 PTS system mannose/fructose/sorbo
MSENNVTITKKDINNTMLRWYFATEISLNYERMQSLAFTYAFLPVLKKLYPDKDDLQEALNRHLELFNTNATAGGLILGTTLAMEEEKANNGSISGDAIVAIKTGLMGPVAAFGDSFSAGTLQTLFILAASAAAAAGSFLSLLLLFIGNAILMAELVITTNLTYNRGREAIKDVLSSKTMNYILEGANILGMGMMGALTATMVDLTTPLSVTFGETAVALQDNLDNLMPGLLTLGVLFIFYYLINKKQLSITKIVLGTIAVSLVLSLFGIV